MSAHWEDLDVEALLARREEQTMAVGAGGATTSANVGAYTVPLGRPLRRAFPTVSKGYSKVKHPYVPDHESVEYPDSGDSDYEWASKLVK